MATAIEFEPKILPTIVEGKTEAIYLVFRQGLQASETLEFGNGDNSPKLRIDVAQDQLPIALEVIGNLPSPKEVPEPPEGWTADKALRELFAFSCTMIHFARSGFQTGGYVENFIPDVAEEARSYSDLVCA